MTALADLITGSATVAGPAGAARPCRLGRILTSLDDTDRAAVLDALHGDRVGDDLLAAHLTRAGHPVSNATLSRHRRKLCHCPTDDVDASFQ